MAQRRKKRSGIFCLALSGALVLLAILLQSSIQVSYQYAVAFQPYGGWYERIREMGAVPAARKQEVSVGSEQVTLYAVDELWQNVFHYSLYEGRSITKRDMEQKTPCIVLSESTARHLFPSGNALGQKVMAEGLSLEVVGLIRDGQVLGEADDAVALIPLSLDMPLDTLSFNVSKTDTSGTAAIWESNFRGLLPGGTFHNMQQSIWVAWLPFYITLLFFLGKGLGVAYEKGKEIASALLQKSKQDLQTHYLRQVGLIVAARGILLLLMGLVFLSAVWTFLLLCTLPLPLFPEYVPENPVQFSSWQQTLSALSQKASAAIQYTSRESTQMKDVCFLSHTACLLFVLGLCRKK